MWLRRKLALYFITQVTLLVYFSSLLNRKPECYNCRKRPEIHPRNNVDKQKAKPKVGGFIENRTFGDLPSRDLDHHLSDSLDASKEFLNVYQDSTDNNTILSINNENTIVERLIELVKRRLGEPSNIVTALTHIKLVSNTIFHHVNLSEENTPSFRKVGTHLPKHIVSNNVTHIVIHITCIHVTYIVLYML